MDTDEACDDGPGNLADIPNACRPDCTLPLCGDGVRDPLYGEQCDDGNQSPGDGCGVTCQVEFCGNAIIDPGETCDDGNTIGGDGCSPDCLSDETCGNRIADYLAGETCDCGSDASNLPELCTAPNGPDGPCNGACVAVYCGNEHIDTGEVCDDGNTIGGDGCSPDCLSDETCGNGRADFKAGETCDCGTDPNHLPLGCTAVNGATGGTCSATCHTLYCGNNVLNSGEVCDDGNLTPGDGCAPDCLSDETCGNGVPDFAMGEFCDDGAANSDAPNTLCRDDCTPRRCGDGILDDLWLEVCDDGNPFGGDGCTGTCAVEPHYECTGSPSTCVCVSYFQGPQCTQCVVYVDVSATGPISDGASWTTAYNAIQDGIDRASSIEEGCEVWVAGGTYTAAVNLRSGVAVYGGFAGVETDRSARDLAHNPSVIDVSTVASQPNSVLVAVLFDGTLNARLDGFTVTGGEAGVGLQEVGPDSVVANCIVTGNTREFCYDQGIADLCGAAGLSLNFGDATILNTLVVGNGCTCAGSGLLKFCGGGGVLSYNSSPRLINCTIADNTIAFANSSNRAGGGIVGIDGGTITLINSILWGNTPDDLDDPPGWTFLPGSTWSVSSSCLQGSFTGSTGTVVLDPLFVDSAGGDYHLQASSPCIDNALDAEAPSTDGEERPRVDVVGVGTTVSDRGAFEYQP